MKQARGCCGYLVCTQSQVRCKYLMSRLKIGNKQGVSDVGNNVLSQLFGHRAELRGSF